MVKSILKKFVPVSILSALGVALAVSQPVALEQGPRCLAKEKTLVDSNKEERADERIYYVGCGGLF